MRPCPPPNQGDGLAKGVCYVLLRSAGRRLLASFFAFVVAVTTLVGVPAIAGPALASVVAKTTDFTVHRTLIPKCAAGRVDSQTTKVGTVVGFTTCYSQNSVPDPKPRLFVRKTNGAQVTIAAPWRGLVGAVAWDGTSSLYVTIQALNSAKLYLGKATNTSTGWTFSTLEFVGNGYADYAALTAKSGRYWVSWNDNGRLRSKHTLFPGAEDRPMSDIRADTGIDLALGADRVSVAYKANDWEASPFAVYVRQNRGLGWGPQRRVARDATDDERISIALSGKATYVTIGTDYYDDTKGGAFGRPVNVYWKLPQRGGLSNQTQVKLVVTAGTAFVAIETHGIQVVRRSPTGSWSAVGSLPEYEYLIDLLVRPGQVMVVHAPEFGDDRGLLLSAT